MSHLKSDVTLRSWISITNMDKVNTENYCNEIFAAMIYAWAEFNQYVVVRHNLR